jgi:hypothetical protein
MRTASRFEQAQLARNMGRSSRNPISLATRLGLYKRYAQKRQNPNLAGVVEAITYSFYDQATFAQNAAFAQTLLFQTPVGQGGKLLSQSDMTFPGVFPNPQRFTIWAICVHISNNTIPADMQNLVQNVTLQLSINTKPYQQGPLALFPAGRGWELVAAAQVGTAPAGSSALYSTSNGPVDPRAVYMMDIPITIEQGEQFNVLLVPQSAFNLTANSTNPPGVGTVITVYLDGNWERGVS